MKAPVDSDDVVQAGTAPYQGYDDELLLANWNPTLAVLASCCGGAEDDSASAKNRAKFESDCDGFLDRVYALATHV